MIAADLQYLSPLLVVALGACVILVLISFVRNYSVAFVLSGVTLLTAFVFLSIPWKMAPRYIGNGMFHVDAFGIFFIGIILFAAFAVAHFAFDYYQKFDDNREEFFVLLLLGTLGGMVLCISNHFLSFFLGLELLSIPLYAMIAYTCQRGDSLEAGIKYLLLAAASSAFLLFGMALIYAELGSMDFDIIAANYAATQGAIDPALILTGLALLVSGIAFKLSLVPFHWWTPDIYQGAPAPVSAFLATVSKAAVVAVTIRFSYTFGLIEHEAVFSAFAAIIILSILFGNLLALMQRNVKRLLAYSSIAHLGYLMIAFIAGGPLGAAAATVYLVAYLLTSLGSFGALSAISTSEGERDTLSRLQGLHFERPGIAALLTLSMLSLAGIPMTAGFIGKFLVMNSAAGDLDVFYPLLLVLIAGSAIGLYYYLRVVWVIYQRPDDSAPAADSESPAGRASEFALFALVVVAVGLLALGIFPGPLIDALNGILAVG